MGLSVDVFIKRPLPSPLPWPFLLFLFFSFPFLSYPSFYPSPLSHIITIMGVGDIISRLKPTAEAEVSASQAETPQRADSNLEKDNGIIDDSPVQYLTWRSFILGLCVSMGGFIFGYSTGRLHNYTITRHQRQGDVTKLLD